MKKVLGLLLILSSMSAMADSMHCGDRLVRTGDDMAQVLLLCGAPDNVEKSLRVEEPQDGDGESVKRVRQAIEVERWSYFPAVGSLGKILIFEEGALIRIEVGQRM